MSKAVKSVASIALPIAAVYFGGPLAASAFGVGSAAGGAIAGGIGGAVGGAIKGGGVGSIVKGAAMGAAGGYLSSGGASELLGGTKVGDALGLTAPQTVSATSSAGENALLTRATQAANAPIGAAATGGGIRSLGNVGTILSGANALATVNSADAATEAAKIQAQAVDKAATVQAPYNKLGTDAAAQIQQIQADPGAYVQNNPFYKSLADDAQQRLLANQAAKGKVASGGTADALQTSLLNLGNGLVQQQVGTLQNQVNSGQTAATNVSNLTTSGGDAKASGVIGSSNAMQSGYQNQINTLLALQNLNRAPSYAPTQQLRA